MNLFQPPPRGGLQRIIRMLSLLLLQHALAPGIIDAHARSRLPTPRGNESPPSLPYLKVAALTPPLRFNSPPPPPDLTSKPAAGAPPQPLASSPTTETAPTAANPLPATLSPAVTPATTPPATAATASAPATPPPPPPPSSILPDDTRPATKAEDFLPFFQFPTNGGDVNVVVPASAARAPTPGQLPPSSATYQQR